MEKASIENINFLEKNTHKYATEYLKDLLEYFVLLQETILLALHNSGNSFALKIEPNNKKLFAYITTVRAFSIAKVSMDITIRGYPLEGLALTRTLAELTRCVDYLLRHEDLIDEFLSGKIKISQVLKKSKREITSNSEDTFGQTWGYMSRFSHATPDWIMLPLMSKEQNRISVDLVNNNSDVISDVAKVITSHLQFQYFIFRIFFLKDISSVDELKKRDSELFDPANVVKLGNTFTGEGRSLEELYNFVMEAYENQ